MSVPLRRVRTLAAQVTNGLSGALQEASDLSSRTLADLPGPAVEDATAYGSRNHHYLTELHEQYGDMFALPRDGKIVVLVRRPDLVRRVLNDVDDFNKTWSSADSSSETVDYVMNLIQPLLRKTIFNMHGDDNRIRRAAFRSTFLGKDHFAAAAEALIPKSLAEWPLEDPLDIQDLCHDLTRKCMLMVLCGEFAEDTFGCLPTFHDVMNYFVKRYSTVNHSQQATAEDDFQMNRLQAAAAEVVNVFRQKLATVDQRSPITDRALLTNCVKAGLSDEEMACTVVNVLIAAGEAPASGLAQTLEQLASSPNLQQQLREEARTLGATGSYAEQLDNLRCASRCIDEGMRVFAPATLVQRVAMRDAFLDDVLIPKGTVIGICVHSVHADAKVWPDARRFNPMRPGLDYETSEGYISFGGGPRGCPGKHAAMAICKVALPLIVSKFQLAEVPMHPPSQQCKKVPKFVEWSVEGIPLRLLPV